ncbi:ABC transporter B family member 25 [Hordeum vulgare]|nr:ABC transporter B family member 25 [Hordeum vulgare]
MVATCNPSMAPSWVAKKTMVVAAASANPMPPGMGPSPPQWGGGGASSAALLPVKREWADEPEDRELVAVKQEPKEIARRGVVGPEDYVGDDVDAVATAISERSLHEETEGRRHDKELEDLVFKQAVATNLTAKDKDDGWRRIRGEQREKFIDLVSSDEEY